MLHQAGIRCLRRIDDDRVLRISFSRTIGSAILVEITDPDVLEKSGEPSWTNSCHIPM